MKFNAKINSARRVFSLALAVFMMLALTGCADGDPATSAQTLGGSAPNNSQQSEDATTQLSEQATPSGMADTLSAEDSDPEASEPDNALLDEQAGHADSEASDTDDGLSDGLPVFELSQTDPLVRNKIRIIDGEAYPYKADPYGLDCIYDLSGLAQGWARAVRDTSMILHNTSRVREVEEGEIMAYYMSESSARPGLYLYGRVNSEWRNYAEYWAGDNEEDFELLDIVTTVPDHAQGMAKAIRDTRIGENLEIEIKEGDIYPYYFFPQDSSAMEIIPHWGLKDITNHIHGVNEEDWEFIAKFINPPLIEPEKRDDYLERGGFITDPDLLPPLPEGAEGYLKALRDFYIADPNKGSFTIPKGAYYSYAVVPANQFFNRIEIPGPGGASAGMWEHAIGTNWIVYEP